VHHPTLASSNCPGWASHQWGIACLIIINFDYKKMMMMRHQKRKKIKIIIITLVTSGVFEQKQHINPGTQKAPPGIWEAFSSLPDPGPDEAASQHT
jgi:hypothetical protein